MYNNGIPRTHNIMETSYGPFWGYKSRHTCKQHVNLSIRPRPQTDVCFPVWSGRVSLRTTTICSHLWHQYLDYNCFSTSIKHSLNLIQAFLNEQLAWRTFEVSHCSFLSIFIIMLGSAKGRLSDSISRGPMYNFCDMCWKRTSSTFDQGLHCLHEI